MDARARLLSSILATLFVALSAMFVPEGALAQTATVARHQADVFGLDFGILFVKRDSLDTARIFDQALVELKSVKGALSPLAFKKDTPLPLSAENFALLERLLRLQKQSAGAYSVTGASLENAYIFEGSAKARPSKEALEAALQDVHSGLKLDALTRSATLDRSLNVDFRRIMKGYALDRVAEVLQKNEVRDALVTLSGMALVLGKRGSEPWTLGVSDPRGTGYFATVQIPEGAVSTRSDQDRFFIEERSPNGPEGKVTKRRVHDVLDARDGLPASLSRSATVWAGDASTAELFSHILFVLGPKEGMGLVEKNQGVEALLVDANNRVTLSSGMEKRSGLKMRAPTP